MKFIAAAIGVTSAAEITVFADMETAISEANVQVENEIDGCFDYDVYVDVGQTVSILYTTDTALAGDSVWLID